MAWKTPTRAAMVVLAFMARIAVCQEASEVIGATGVEAGLAVHVGTTDGRLEAGLTNGGRMLVHGLALSDASRDKARAAIMGRGLYGLAEQAIVFTRAASNYPVCSPFRAMLMTGQYTVQSSFAQRSRLRIRQIGR